MDTLDKLIMIYQRSGLSVSRFASIIGKDRRTLTSWIDKSVCKDPPKEVLESITRFFRYSERVWDQECDKDEFLALLEHIPQSEIKIIDKGYEGGLEYILEKEYDRRFVIHSRFPGPAYRDKIVTFPYKFGNSPQAVALRKRRCEHILDYGFESVEWYSIESLLHFAFSPIGNFYTTSQKIAVLDLMLKTFEDNYNKSLYFFDSQTTKVSGIDTIYMSINPKAHIMFFKIPIDSLIVEITNKMLVYRIHKHFTTPSSAPKHIPKDDAPKILSILKDCIQEGKDIVYFCKNIKRQTPFLPIFSCNLSVELHHLI